MKNYGVKLVEKRPIYHDYFIETTVGKILKNLAQTVQQMLAH
jgi:hypothetical protein